MAKKKKLPRRPKMSSSLQTWQRYEARVKDVCNYNKKLESDKVKKANLIAKIQKSCRA